MVQSSRRDELIMLRDAHKLSRADIARMTGVSIHTVNCWFNPSTSNNSRDIPENLLRLLEFEIAAAYSETI